MRFLLALALLCSSLNSSVIAQGDAVAASVHQVVLSLLSQPGSAPIGSLTVFEAPNEFHYTGGFMNLTCSEPSGCDLTVVPSRASSCDSLEVLQGAAPAQVDTGGGTSVRLQGTLESSLSSGQAIVVQSASSGPIACGILQAIDEDHTLVTTATALGDSGVRSTAMVVSDPLSETGVCFFGRAMGLEASVSSFLLDDTNTQCRAANGCGVHVHSGTDCTDSSTQGGHYYNSEVLDQDPWALVGYTETDATGLAIFLDCVDTGETQYDGKAFVVHAEDGSRVACGILAPPSTTPTNPIPPPNPDNLEINEEGPHPVYQASLAPVEGSTVAGMVSVFVLSDSTLALSGTATGLPANLGMEACGSRAGCALRIQNATSCVSDGERAFGRAYFDSDKVSTPWRELKYETDANGMTSFSAMLNVGVTDIEGLVFILRGPDGEVVCCGNLVKTLDFLATDTVELGSSGVSSFVTAAVSPIDDTTVCMFATARGLGDPDVRSFLVGGPDCTATNGCGMHIHSGNDCTDSTSQGGHYYDSSVISEDPWRIVGYTMTNEGAAHFVDCVTTGETVFKGKAFLVHAEDGSRVSCGLLESSIADDPVDGGGSGAHSFVLWASLFAVCAQVWWM